ncbi:phage head spike fiber domain-containing protein [Comamonas testosteroni]|uniref:phage head spike fiber domain-containing protein n=1 Tax=Comamonas testosteroni TaxID=285 RepID=UPI00068334BF|nr:hypothetical protein [Comamonas testosteroni]
MANILNLPDLRPSLLLDFANSRQVDPRVTFTRASAATRWNAAGVLETVPAGVPRIDYDPATGKCLGLLVEGARTNLRTNSRQPTASTGTVLGTSTAIAPDGFSVTSIEDDPATSVEHYVNDLAVAVTTGQTFVQSVFVKAMPGAERQVVLRVAGSVAGSQSLVFNVSDAACTTTSTPSYPYGIQKCLNGWWRIWSQYTAIGDFAAAVFRVQVYKNNSGGYQGEAGKGLFLFGRQVEAGSSPSSYIPAGASVATRADEFAGLLGANFSNWYRPEEGTFLFEGAPSSIASGCGLFSVGDASLNFESRNGIYLSTNAGTGLLSPSMAVAGAAQVSPNAVTGAFASGVSKKTAFAYQADNTVGATDGVLGVVDTLCAIPKGVTALSLGELSAGWMGSGSPRLGGHIRRFAFYPKRLTAAELKRITEA